MPGQRNVVTVDWHAVATSPCSTWTYHPSRSRRRHPPNYVGRYVVKTGCPHLVRAGGAAGAVAADLTAPER